MILVDVTVPSLNKTYDFQLDEKVPVSMIIDEISEMIIQKERCELIGERASLMLCSMKDGRELPVNASLEQSRIVVGDTLILV